MDEPKSDHDLLIILHTEVKGLRADIAKMSESTTKRVEDHETRIRTIESKMDDLSTVKKIVYGGAAFILVAFLSGVAYYVIPKH